MIRSTQQRVVGQPLDRIDGPKKVTGTATYAFEHALDEVTYAFPVQSTIANGRIVSIDTSAAQAIPGAFSCSRTRMHRASRHRRANARFCNPMRLRIAVSL